MYIYHRLGDRFFFSFFILLSYFPGPSEILRRFFFFFFLMPFTAENVKKENPFVFTVLSEPLKRPKPSPYTFMSTKQTKKKNILQQL